MDWNITINLPFMDILYVKVALVVVMVTSILALYTVDWISFDNIFLHRNTQKHNYSWN